MPNKLLNMNKYDISTKDFNDISKYSIIQKVKELCRENLLILLFSLAYLLIVLTIVGYKGKYFNISWSWTILNNLAVIFYPIFIISQIAVRLPSSVRERYYGLPKITNEIYSSYINFQRIAGVIIIYFSIPIFIMAFTNYKQTLCSIIPFYLDKPFMLIDYYLHFGHHPWTLLQPLLGRPFITSFFDKLYMVWFFEMFFIIFWMSWSSRRFLRAQFFVSFILLWIFLGTLMATLLSSAGPCYYGNVTGLPDPYAPLLAYLHKVNLTHPLFALHNQQSLWDAYEKGQFLPFGGISAMPSMHVAGAVLFALVGWETNKWLGISLIAFAVLILIGSVCLAWHYAIDGYFSALGTLLLWRVTKWGLKSSVIGRRLFQS
jgi:hypothetical protein